MEYREFERKRNIEKEKERKRHIRKERKRKREGKTEKEKRFRLERSAIWLISHGLNFTFVRRSFFCLEMKILFKGSQPKGFFEYKLLLDNSGAFAEKFEVQRKRKSFHSILLQTNKLGNI